jgi:hypothetical protein
MTLQLLVSPSRFHFYTSHLPADFSLFRAWRDLRTAVAEIAPVIS